MTDKQPTPEARAASQEVEIVFTDRLHIKAHLHDTDTRRNIALALDAFAERARIACLADLRKLVPTAYELGDQVVRYSVDRWLEVQQEMNTNPPARKVWGR